MKITLIRHTSVAVAPGTCYGASDVEVASTFTEEALKVANQLSGKNFDAVFSSPLSRCRKLAAFCGYPHPRTDERLKELNFGEWEMQKWEHIQDPFLEEWYKDWLHLPAGHGESFLQQYHRVCEFLEEIKREAFVSPAVFAHGGVLRCAQIYAGEAGFSEAFVLNLPYGCVLELDI